MLHVKPLALQESPVFHRQIPRIEKKRKESPPETLACNNHAVHLACMIGSIDGDLNRFNELNLSMWNKHVRCVGLPVRYIENYRFKRVAYEFRFSKAALPRCATCRDQRGSGEIRMATVDEELPWVETDAKVTLFDPTPLPALTPGFA